MNLKFPTMLFTLLFAGWSATANAYESFGLSSDQQECFARAMIGMDSVINSRLGLPPEHALEISRVRVKDIRSAGDDFDNVVLNVMLNAYLWKTSPHSYAIKVFYDCAKSQAITQQAQYSAAKH